MGISVKRLGKVEKDDIDLAVNVQDFGPVVNYRGMLCFARQTTLVVGAEL